MFKIHSFPEKTPQNSIPEIYLFLGFELFPLSCSSAYIPEHVYYFLNIQLSTARKEKLHHLISEDQQEMPRSTPIPIKQ